MKDYSFKPYEVCIGRKYRYLPQLYRPVSITLYARLCNQYYTEKNKIRFLKQFFRWFIKDPVGYKIKLHFKERYTSRAPLKISDGDIINLTCRTNKAAWKKWLSRLNYELIDYKVLKRRKYCLFFRFIFCELHKSSKEITLDIKCTRYDGYHILITLNSFYLSSFLTIIENGRIWKKLNKKEKKILAKKISEKRREDRKIYKIKMKKIKEKLQDEKNHRIYMQRVAEYENRF